MKFHHKFKSIDYSDHLTAYAESKFSKVEKFELKPINVHITFSAQKHRKIAEVYITGPDVKYQAKAWSENYYESLDKVIHKIVTQMSKKKKRLQSHKKFDKSGRARAEYIFAQEGDLRRVS